MTDDISVYKKKRLGIFYFQDEKGYVDRYIDVLLKGMSDFISDLYIIAGGKLSAGGRKKFNEYTDIILCDQSISSSIQGYKRAVQVFGSDLLGRYDEVVFFSNNLMGPVCSLEGLFGKMDESEADYWGIIPDYSREEKVSDYMIVFRQHMIKSVEFSTYWNNVVFDENYTRYFTDKGFQWQTFIDAAEIKSLNEAPLLFYPYEILKKYNCPFFLKESFTVEYRRFIDESAGQASLELYEYLREETVYDMNVLWEYMLRTCHQSDLVKNLHLTYILPQRKSDKSLENLLRRRRIAMLIHIYRTDMAEELSVYASYMPNGTDIYVTTDTEKKKEEIECIFRKNGINRLHVRLIQNRGRDVSSKLVGMKDVIMDYDYVCCIHDKKTPHLKPMSIGDSFGYKCFNNIIPSSDYALNVIELFENNPRLGIAVPPEPNHATFFTTLGLEWVGNYDAAKALAEKLELNVPMDAEKEPVAPFGSFFWFRPRALKKLYDQDWEYEDFPAEPISDDATILHAIERIYPFVAQAEGYYPAVIMSDKYARIEHTNLHHYVQGYNRVMISHGLLDKHSTLCEVLNNVFAVSEERMDIIRLYEAQIADLNKRLGS